MPACKGSQGPAASYNRLNIAAMRQFEPVNKRVAQRGAARIPCGLSVTEDAFILGASSAAGNIDAQSLGAK